MNLPFHFPKKEQPFLTVLFFMLVIIGAGNIYITPLLEPPLLPPHIKLWYFFCWVLIIIGVFLFAGFMNWLTERWGRFEGAWRYHNNLSDGRKHVTEALLQLQMAKGFINQPNLDRAYRQCIRTLEIIERKKARILRETASRRIPKRTKTAPPPKASLKQ